MSQSNRPTAHDVRLLTFLLAAIDVQKDVIPFDNLYRGLPFATSELAGAHFNHIVNESAGAFVLETGPVFPGDTLCRRSGSLYSFANPTFDPCPGCTAIAQGIIASKMSDEISDALDLGLGIGELAQPVTDTLHRLMEA